MAIIRIISNETRDDQFQYLGDVAGVYPDGFPFSQDELDAFDFLTVNGSKADVEAVLEQIRPTEAKCYLWNSDNKYHWEPHPDGDDTIQDVYKVEGSKRWYKLETDFKFPTNVSSLTPEEKQLLETVDINHPSVDSFIRKIIKDFTTQPGNDVEINDLRNTDP